MKLKSFLEFSTYGLKTIFFKNTNPILATIILTDYCNLTCKHCAVNNINKIIHPYEEIKEEMINLYNEGVRILFFCGGETLLWNYNGKNAKDLIREAKEIGFELVNIVTNGTIDLDIKEADIIFLSIDGTKENHNYIRGNTFDTILKNVEKANESNICVYMAINNKNYKDIRELCELVKNTKNLKSISFNFHTPYEGTENLSLSREQKIEVVNTIKQLIREGYPIFNLYSALDYYLDNNWKRPCNQCLVIENKKRFVCGRCVEIDGLCNECGYLFAVEFVLLFGGNPKIIYETLKTYLKFV